MIMTEESVVKNPAYSHEESILNERADGLQEEKTIRAKSAAQYKRYFVRQDIYTE